MFTNDLICKQTKASLWHSASPTFDARCLFPAVVFQDLVWVLGGQGAHNLSDIWTSSDGITSWTAVVPTTPYTARFGHQAIVYDGQMYILAGISSAGVTNDVFASSDGLIWNQLQVPEWAARHSAGVYVFNGKLFVTSGAGGHSDVCDVWSFSSASGSWAQETSCAAFGVREAFGVAVLKSQVWVFGGRVWPGDQVLNDLWNSYDGIVFSQATMAGSALPAVRSSHRMVVHINSLWIVGGDLTVPGQDATYYDDAFSSCDGDAWQREPSMPTPGRSAFGAVSFKGNLIVLQGRTFGGALLSDAVYLAASAPFSSPSLHCCNFRCAFFLFHFFHLPRPEETSVFYAATKCNRAFVRPLFILSQHQCALPLQRVRH